MRREWTTWIKERNWGELERVAKKDPSQMLADTVSELVRGFDAKADKRALKRILYFLEQAGFEPQELEEESPAGSMAPVEAYEAAYMMGPEPDGAFNIIYVVQKDPSRDKVRVLNAQFNWTGGVIKAQEDEISVQEAKRYFARVSTPSEYFPSAVVPVPFAVSRLAEAVEKTEYVTPVVAYWRSSFKNAPRIPHPAEALPRAEVTPEERMERCVYDIFLTFGRLEPGGLMTFLDDLTQAVSSEMELSEEEVAERQKRVMDQHRPNLITDKMVEEHRDRVLNLAYLNYLSDQPFEVYLAVADDLRERGAMSDYAAAMFNRSAMHAIEIIAKTSAPPRMSRAD